MLGVRSANSLSFYEWDNLTLIRRIEIQPKGVFWSENGELVCISTEDSYFILRYDADAVAKSLETKEGLTDDAGIEVCRLFFLWHLENALIPFLSNLFFRLPLICCRKCRRVSRLAFGWATALSTPTASTV